MKGKEDKTKVLFLDIDGVLNSKIYFESDYYKFRKMKYGKSQAQIDDRTIPLLKKIHDETKCKIVMSSSWRCFYFDKKPGLYRMLKKAGIRITDKIGNEYNNELSNKYHKHTYIQNEKGLYDVIWNGNPNPEPVKEFFGRGLQIQCWLKMHPEVKSFAVLDDDVEDLCCYNMDGYKRFVQTSWYSETEPGLQLKHAEEVISILNDPKAPLRQIWIKQLESRCRTK